MGTWINPEKEVREISEAVDNGNVTINELTDMYNKYKEGENIDGKYSNVIASLVENQSNSATMAAVTRYVVHKRYKGQFPWKKKDADEQYDADELVDENISESDIREAYDELGDVGSVVAELFKELPEDMSDDTRSKVKKVLSGKCGRVLDL